MPIKSLRQLFTPFGRKRLYCSLWRLSEERQWLVLLTLLLLINLPALLVWATYLLLA